MDVSGGAGGRDCGQIGIKEKYRNVGDKMGSRLNKYVSNYVVFDLETTGISTTDDEVVEISAVKVKDGEVTDEFTTLVNPGRHIPEQASAVNGITDEMVADSPCFDEALADFLEFAGDMILVGHNIHSFDLKFLYRDAKKFWGKDIENDYVDTLSLSRECHPELSHHKLVDMAEHYGISSEGAHRALNDCRMNQKVYEMLGRELNNPERAKVIKKCPKCGNTLRKRNGMYGEFYGCSRFPMCKYTENI